MNKRTQSTIYIRTSPDVKEQFDNLKEEEQLGGSSLINFLMKNYLENGKVLRNIEKDVRLIKENLNKDKTRKLRDEQTLK